MEKRKPAKPPLIYTILERVVMLWVIIGGVSAPILFYLYFLQNAGSPR